MNRPVDLSSRLGMYWCGPEVGQAEWGSMIVKEDRGVVVIVNTTRRKSCGGSVAVGHPGVFPGVINVTCIFNVRETWVNRKRRSLRH